MASAHVTSLVLYEYFRAWLDPMVTQQTRRAGHCAHKLMEKKQIWTFQRGIMVMYFSAANKSRKEINCYCDSV
jgi:hypothetical protein